jgi:hypothetical protein
MVSEKLKKGRVLIWPKPLYAVKSPTNKDLPEGFKFYNDFQFRFPIKNGGGIEFWWLPYLPGIITCTLLIPGKEILTGEMSGCKLGRFSFKGQWYACHVGTSSDDPGKSQTAKKAWSNAVNQKIITPHFLIDPVHLFKPINVDKNKKFIKFYGVFDRETVYGLAVSLSHDGKEYTVEDLRAMIGLRYEVF